MQVLDHGYVLRKEVWGSDETIIESARMSSGKGFLGWGERHAETCPSTIPPGWSHKTKSSHAFSGECNCKPEPGDEKLLAYLWNNKHTSPFEQCGARFEVQAPIMVFREWHRHRTLSVNEMSARYTQMPDIHYLPAIERVVCQSKTNKQASGTEALPVEVVNEFRDRMRKEQEMIYANYQWALDHGIAREIARINTPVSRYSRMVVSANLLNWYRFLGLRLAENSQWEIRQYAQAIAAGIEEAFPRSYELFKSRRV